MQSVPGRHANPPTDSAVAEIQGLYGPFTISERLIQKIWQRQDFFKKYPLKTVSGKTLHIINPGRWNFQEGPDFREAQIKLDGTLCLGDVEVHFFAKDWLAHSHDGNPSFNKVILHAVLFNSRPEETQQVCTENGSYPETLVMLPFLHYDIEAYACCEAILSLGKQKTPETPNPLKELPPDIGRERLREKAWLRWRQKCTHSSKRLDTHRWEESCHQLCLEALGYRRNREPMATLALQFPLKEMAHSNLRAEDLFQHQHTDWKLSGLRPANHPRRRLSQYLQLLKKQPHWPETLRQALKKTSLLRTAVIRYPELTRISPPDASGRMADAL